MRRIWSIAVVMAAGITWTATLPAARPPASLTGGIGEHVTQQGESLVSIAARVGVDAATLAADNNLLPQAVLDIGQRLRIDNRHIVPAIDAELVLNVAQRMLFHRRGDASLAGYPVAVGNAGWQTPRGPFTVVNKRTNPAWNVPPSILEESRTRGRQLPRVVPPGPTNPLGTRWIGLSLPGVGIHGTNVPASIFKAVSHGCVRLHPDDVVELYERVAVGTVGRSVYEPVLLTRVDGRVYLEVHRDIYRVFGGRLAASVHHEAAALGLSHEIDWGAADMVIAARAGIAREVTRR